MSCASSSNLQSCVWSGLQFLDVVIWYDRASYYVCIFEIVESLKLIVESIQLLIKLNAVVGCLAPDL